jgi:hypothetical protein
VCFLYVGTFTGVAHALFVHARAQVVVVQGYAQGQGHTNTMRIIEA